MSDDGQNTEHRNYSDKSFWAKLKRFAQKAGREVVEMALKLYYAAQLPETPAWAKAAIFAALAYFISPIDAIPDAIPVVGFTDDLGVLGAALAVCTVYITDEVKQKAAEKAYDWFGK